MSDYLAGFGIPDWLPAQVQRAMHTEAVAEAKQAREAKRDLEARRADGHERALRAYKEQAEWRGEYIGVMDMATGQVQGRTVADVLAGAQAAGDHDDARALHDRRAAQGEVPVFVGEGSIGRSDGWPESSYQADRLIRQAEELHRFRIEYMARHNYPEALEAARAKSTHHGEARRDGGYQPEITRVAPGAFVSIR